MSKYLVPLREETYDACLQAFTLATLSKLFRPITVHSNFASNSELKYHRITSIGAELAENPLETERD
jgi:hypothetical protein